MGKVKGRSKRVDVTKHFLRAPHIAEQITVYISGSQSVQATEDDFSQTLGSESAFALRKDGKLDVSMRLCSNWRQGACHSNTACTFAHLKAYLNCPAGVINPVPAPANGTSGGSLSYSAVAAIGVAPQSSGGADGATGSEQTLNSPHRGAAASQNGTSNNPQLNDSLTRSFGGDSGRGMSENDSQSFLSSQHAYSIPPRLQSPRGPQQQVASRGQSVTGIPSSGASSHERNSIPIPRSQQHTHTDSVNSSGSTPTLTSAPAPTTVAPLLGGVNAWTQKKAVTTATAAAAAGSATTTTTAVPATKVVSRDLSGSVLPATASWGQRVVQRPINFSSLPTLPSANDGTPPKTSERAQRTGNQNRIPAVERAEKPSKKDPEPPAEPIEQPPQESNDAVFDGESEVNPHENEHVSVYETMSHAVHDDPIGSNLSGNPVGCVGWGSSEPSTDLLAGGSSQLWSEAYSPWGSSGVASPSDPFSPMMDSGARHPIHTYSAPEFGGGSFGRNEAARSTGGVPKTTSPNDAWTSALRALSPDCEPLSLPHSGMEDEHLSPSAIASAGSGIRAQQHASSSENNTRVTPNYHADPPAPSTDLLYTLMRQLVNSDETGVHPDNLPMGAASGDEHISNAHWDGAQDAGARYATSMHGAHHDHQYTQFSTAYLAGGGGPSDASHYTTHTGNGPSGDSIDMGVTFSTQPFSSKQNPGAHINGKNSNGSQPWDSNGDRNRDEGGAYTNAAPQTNSIQHLLALLTTEE